MAGLSVSNPVQARDHAACSGCSLCFLVCPMWRARRDPRFSPQGVAKALQCGATVAELAAPIEACALCGACDPVCPEGIDLSGLFMDLRRRRPALPDRAGLLEAMRATLTPDAPAAVPKATSLLLPGPALRADAALLARVEALLGATLAEDDGADIAFALESGAAIDEQRLRRFLAPLRDHTIVAADGLLLRQLRRWLPGSRRVGLGAALSSMAAVRAKLGPGDLYVIEARAYHADYQRLVIYYGKLQTATGCMLNLDLQRIAIPAAAPGLARVSTGDDGQARWILQGRAPARIVIESLAERAAFEQICDIPVVHVAELAQD